MNLASSREPFALFWRLSSDVWKTAFIWWMRLVNSAEIFYFCSPVPQMCDKHSPIAQLVERAAVNR
jgi:hypothetical protein